MRRTSPMIEVPRSFINQGRFRVIEVMANGGEEEKDRRAVGGRLAVLASRQSERGRKYSSEPFGGAKYVAFHKPQIRVYRDM